MKNKTIITLYYLASALFYLSALINLYHSCTSKSLVWFSLGSACLCFGASSQSKEKTSDDKDTKDKD